jgi:hypothetical protein
VAQLPVQRFFGIGPGAVQAVKTDIAEH